MTRRSKDPNNAFTAEDAEDAEEGQEQEHIHVKTFIGYYPSR